MQKKKKIMEGFIIYDRKNQEIAIGGIYTDVIDAINEACHLNESVWPRFTDQDGYEEWVKDFAPPFTVLKFKAEEIEECQ